MKTEILRLLKESDSYISGQQLCDQFQVSRTAVWKAIEQLKKSGYQIKAVRNKGYLLVESPDVMTKEELTTSLPFHWAGSDISYFDEIGSTNNEAKMVAERCSAKGIDPHGKLLVADMQSAGKGRRGRSWVSPSGTSISYSLILKPDLSPDKAPMLTLVMAISVVNAIKNITGLDAKIKWPNDIVVNGKKVCGILTEMSLEMNHISYVVIGVGVNVNQEEFPEEIEVTATSLRKEAGTTFKRAEIIVEAMRLFEEYYDVFIKAESLIDIKEEYNATLVNVGRQVRVLEPKGEYQAEAKGIDEIGQLLVRLPDGSEKKVFAGEVSVRGIYGYT